MQIICNFYKCQIIYRMSLLTGALEENVCDKSFFIFHREIRICNKKYYLKNSIYGLDSPLPVDTEN